MDRQNSALKSSIAVTPQMSGGPVALALFQPAHSHFSLAHLSLRQLLQGSSSLLSADGITAQNELSQAGLIVKIIYATDKTQPANVVLAQSPSGGTTQSIGSNITITVNQLPTN